MNRGQFLLQLAITTAISVAVVLVCNLRPEIAAAQVLSWTTIFIFILFLILVYLISSFASKQANKHIYTNVILAAMMTKMFICILGVAVFAKIAKPSSNLFLIPFFIIYILYTIFEVHLMTKIGGYGRLKK